MLVKLIASVRKSLVIVQATSVPKGRKKSTTKPCKTFPVHEQIEHAVNDDWVTSERPLTPPKFFTEFYTEEK